MRFNSRTNPRTAIRPRVRRNRIVRMCTGMLAQRAYGCSESCGKVGVSASACPAGGRNPVIPRGAKHHCGFFRSRRFHGRHYAHYQGSRGSSRVWRRCDGNGAPGVRGNGGGLKMRTAGQHPDRALSLYVRSPYRKRRGRGTLAYCLELAPRWHRCWPCQSTGATLLMDWLVGARDVIL